MCYFSLAFEFFYYIETTIYHGRTFIQLCCVQNYLKRNYSMIEKSTWEFSYIVLCKLMSFFKLHWIKVNVFFVFVIVCLDYITGIVLM